jgi:hypothetical protein
VSIFVFVSCPYFFSLGEQSVPIKKPYIGIRILKLCSFSVEAYLGCRQRSLPEVDSEGVIVVSSSCFSSEKHYAFPTLLYACTFFYDIPAT